MIYLHDAVLRRVYTRYMRKLWAAYLDPQTTLNERGKALDSLIRFEQVP